MKDYTLNEVRHILGEDETRQAAMCGSRWCEFKSCDWTDYLERHREILAHRVAIAPGSDEEKHLMELISAYHSLACMARKAAGDLPEELTSKQWDAYLDLVESQSEEYIPNG